MRAAAPDRKEIDAVLTHMKDRFGSVPKEVGTLAAEAGLRVFLSRMGALTAQRVGDFLEITLRERRKETVEALIAGGFRQVKPNKLVIETGAAGPEDLLKLLPRILPDFVL